MSSKFRFRIFYGKGNIRYTPDEVDLSSFRSTVSGIDIPAEKCFETLHKWLLRAFSIDSETHLLTFQTLVTRSSYNEFWELMPIQTNSEWKMYVKEALQEGWSLVMLVQTFVKPSLSQGIGLNQVTTDVMVEELNVEESQQRSTRAGYTFIGAHGQADEGERIPTIVEHIEDKDEAQIMHGGEDSSDKEDGQIPADLISKNDACREWEYRVNEIAQGDKFATADALKNSVKLWSISLGKKFKVVKSGKRVYEVRCVNDGCPWRVHAFFEKQRYRWICSVVTEHTCYQETIDKCHRKMTSTFIANEMCDQIVNNLNYEPQSIIRTIKNKFKYTISYAKAWRAKLKALEMRFGPYEASYDNLPRMLATIVRRNPGSFYDIKCLPDAEGGPSILQCSFFCLNVCAKAFEYFCPVICIDGAFLTGKYKGHILTAIGFDGNKQLLPVALAFVEGENYDSWYWFLERLKNSVVCDRPGVCLIHNRHLGIMKAIEEMQEGHGTEPPKWPDVKSRWCMRHMGTDFYDHFKNKQLADLFKKLCIQNQERKFNALWKELDELTAKLAQEVSNIEGASSSSCLTQSSRAQTFSEWIENRPKEKWSLLYDDGSRYGVMTTNKAQFFNILMPGCRIFPLVGIVESFIYGLIKYFRERLRENQSIVNDARFMFCRRTDEYMNKKLEKARKHRVRLTGTIDHRFEVYCPGKEQHGVHDRRIVQECVLRDDGSCYCTCHKPRLLHMPCSHVIAASVEAGIQANSYISSYFTKEAVRNSWAFEIYGYRILGPFTDVWPYPIYVPDPSSKRGRQQS